MGDGKAAVASNPSTPPFFFSLQGSSEFNKISSMFPLLTRVTMFCLVFIEPSLIYAECTRNDSVRRP